MLQDERPVTQCCPDALSLALVQARPLRVVWRKVDLPVQDLHRLQVDCRQLFVSPELVSHVLTVSGGESKRRASRLAVQCC